MIGLLGRGVTLGIVVVVILRSAPPGQPMLSRDQPPSGVTQTDYSKDRVSSDDGGSLYTLNLTARLLDYETEMMPPRLRDAFLTPAWDTVRVLFIGNSYTYYNNLPGTVEEIAAASSCPLKASQVTIPGGSLARHWARGTAVDSIQHDHWDYIVLQEQGLLGGRDVDGVMTLGRPDTFYAYARRFETEARRAGARLAFLNLWTREGHPEIQAALDSVYYTVSRELHAVVIPAGRAWGLVRDARPDLRLTESDGYHPNGVGTYLTAVAVAEVLCGGLPGAAMPTRILVDSIDNGGNLVPGRKTSTILSRGTAAILWDAARSAVLAVVDVRRDR